jgi:hypothetical protein
VIKRAGRGGVLAKRDDADTHDLFADQDEIIDEIDDDAPPTDAPHKRSFTKLQFALAALSATPVLFIGGIGGWPWEDKPAVAENVVAGPAHHPASISLARLGISTPLDALTTDPLTDVIQVPALGRAGWIESGAEPGELGRSVVLGRRSTDGADVFAKLTKARAGDKIVVTTVGGQKLTFVVQSVEQFRTGEVPVARVYGGGKKQAQLRLITSTGDYNQARGGFPRNVVVFADLAK